MADSNIDKADVTISFGSYYKQIIGSDVLKSAITAFFTAFFSTVILALMPLFNGPDLPQWVDIRVVMIAGISSGLGALARKFWTNSVGQPFKKDPKAVTTVKE